MKVTIRIWLKADEKYGHVSIQTRDFEGNPDDVETTKGVSDQGIYVSIYPLKKVSLLNREGLSFTCRTLEQDKKKNSITPHTFTFHHLRGEKIESAYKELIQNGFKFSFLATFLFGKKNTQNCSGICFYLLAQGGAKFPNYPMTDFYSHSALLCKTVEFLSQKNNETKMTRLLIGLGLGMSETFAARGLGAFSEIFLDNTKLHPFTLGNVFGWAAFGRLIMKNSCGSHKLQFAFASVSIFGLLLHYNLVRKTITPTGMVAISKYNEDLEKNKYATFLPHYNYLHDTGISRNQLNIVLALISFLSNAWLVCYRNESESSHHSSRLMMGLDFGFSLGLNSYLSSQDPRIPLSAFLAAIPFIWQGYPNCFGLLGTLSTVTNLILSPYNLLWSIASKLIFYFSDWIINKIENSENVEQGNVPQREIITDANKNLSTVGFFREKLSVIMTPRNIIKAGAYTVSTGLAFFAAKNLAISSDKGKTAMMTFSIK